MIAPCMTKSLSSFVWNLATTLEGGILYHPETAKEALGRQSLRSHVFAANCTDSKPCKSVAELYKVYSVRQTNAYGW